MRGSNSFLPGPHQLVGWERRVWCQLAMLLVLCACAVPIVAYELEQAWVPLARLPAWIRSRSAREITGIAGASIVVFQLSLAVVKRLFGARPGVLRCWRAAHQLAPIVLLGLVLLHTRGQAGANLNRWLISVLLLQIFMVQGGHVAKAWFAKHARGGLLDRLDQAANTPSGLIHKIGLHAHVLLATALAILLAVHVFAVYYF